jgi:hypothetical protein
VPSLCRGEPIKCSPFFQTNQNVAPETRVIVQPGSPASHKRIHASREPEPRLRQQARQWGAAPILDAQPVQRPHAHRQTGKAKGSDRLHRHPPPPSARDPPAARPPGSDTDLPATDGGPHARADPRDDERRLQRGRHARQPDARCHTCIHEPESVSAAAAVPGSVTAADTVDGCSSIVAAARRRL